jgi:transposase
VSGWVLARIAEHGLVKGERIGVDASTMEANAALRTIVRRDFGETYREILKRMARRAASRRPRPTISFARTGHARARSCPTRTG